MQNFKCCNMCGINNQINREQTVMFHNFNIRFLYPSELDLQQCALILCEECLMKILRSCLVPVKLTEYSPFDNQPLDITTLDNSALDIISNDNDSGNNENNLN